MGSLFSKPADDEAIVNQQNNIIESSPNINNEQQNSILTKASNDESKKTVSSSSDDSSDDESDSSSSSSSSSDDDSDSAAAVSADSGSDSESELMEKMYGFTKKTAHSDFKRPTTTTDIQQQSQKQNTANDLKRKREEESKDATSASSNMMMISKEQVEDWIRNIQLPEHIELIALGQVSSHIMNTVVIRADNEYTTGQKVWDEQQKNKKTGATSAAAVPVNPSDDNDIHIGGQYDEEDENDDSKVENAESLMRTVAPQVFQPTPTTTVVITPNSDAMNELVNRRMLQKQREKMMGQSTEFKRQEEEWRNTLLLRVGEGTVVFDENRKPVGKIVDIFGPVHQPFYRLAIVQPAPTLETVSTAESTAAPVDHVVAETIQQEQSIVEEQQTQMNENSVDKEQPLEPVKEAITTEQQEKLSVDQPMDMQEDEVEQDLDIVLESEQAEEEQKSEEQPIPSKEEAVVEPLANLTGNTLYFVIQHSSILNVSNVIDSTIKGSDGTGEKDMELDVEFSDDEDEAKSNKRKRQKVSHNNSTDMQFANTRGRGRGGSRGSARGRGGMVRGRGRGRGRGGRYHPYATGDEGHPVDYSDFAKLFNQMVPAPGSPQHETPAYEPVTDYPSYVPCSPPHSPSPAQND